MKKISILLALTLFAYNQCANANDFESFINGTKKYYTELQHLNGIGRIVNQDGKIIIDNYNGISIKEEGAISEYFVKKDNKWGLINEKNEIILDFLFDRFDNRYENYIVLRKDGKWGLLEDKTYKQIMPFEFDYIKVLDDGNILATKGKLTGLFDKNNVQILPFEYDNIRSIKNEKNHYIAVKQAKFGVIDKNNNIIVPFKYRNIYHEGCAIQAMSENNKIDLYDKQGKKLVNSKTGDITISCEEGMATFETESGKRINYFFIKEAQDEYEKTLEDFKKPYSSYDNIKPVPNAGIAIVKKEQDKYIFVDKDGNRLNSENFDNVVLNNEIERANTTQGLDYLNGIAKITDCDGKFIVIKNNKFGLVDKNGKTLFEPQYRVIRGLKKDQFGAFLDDKYGEIDKNNNIIKPFSSKSEYTTTKDKKEETSVQVGVIKPKEYKTINLNPFEKTYYGLKKDNGKYQILDKNGFDVDENIEYDSLDAILNSYIKYGYMKAKIGDSFAIFDENSNKLFTIKANDINKFYNTEYFIVKTNTGYYTVNKKGERIENTEFLKYEQPKFVPSEYKKYIIISNSDSKKGMVNEKGIIFIKPIYDDFYFSFPLILLKKDNKLGYYNVKTKEFSDCKYDGVSRFQGNKRHNNWIFYLNGIKTEVKN